MAAMGFRPHFAYSPPPPGFSEDDFEYVFAAANTPMLGIPLLPGQSMLDITLGPLETDAEYRVRSIEVIDPSIGQLAGLRLRDASGTLLVEQGDWVPSEVFSVSGQGIPLESELVCPGGSALTLDLTNLF
jgi:hypothetical protein